MEKFRDADANMLIRAEQFNDCSTLRILLGFYIITRFGSARTGGLNKVFAFL